MPMLKFTFPGGQPIWINPDKVISSQAPRELTSTSMSMAIGRFRNSAEDVVAKIEQAKER